MSRPLILCVLFAGLSSPVPVVRGTAAPIPKDLQKLDQFYPITPGTKWTYYDGTRVFTRVLTEAKVKGEEVTLSIGEITATGDTVSAETLVVSSKGLFMRENVGLAYDPPLCLLKYASSPGDSWKNNCICEKTKIEGKVTIRELEDVDVPAGKYRAFRVDWENTSNGIIGQATFWYAPGVGVVKKVYSDKDPKDRVEHVLKSFKSGKE